MFTCYLLTNGTNKRTCMNCKKKSGMRSLYYFYLRFELNLCNFRTEIK